MRQLSIVQLFSWFPFFLLWVYSTTAISQHYFGVPMDYNASENTDSVLRNAFDEAGNWVGMCFAMYSLIAAIYSIALPKLIALTSRKTIYSFSLLVGGLSFISLFFFTNQYHILISMVGIGMAWAAILSMPYAMLSDVLPPKRIGIYMGLFNLTVVVPQILSGLIGGPILRSIFQNQGIYILVLAGVIMILGALSVMFIKQSNEDVH